jgi:hypothetical protein
MAYASRDPVRTTFGRARSLRAGEAPGLAWLFVLFLVGGALVARAAVAAPPPGAASLGPFAQLLSGRAPERPKQGAVPAAEAAPAAAPFCGPGQAPRFVLGFAALQAALGETMGEPLECEHARPEDGRTLQRTTTGLAVYDDRTGRAAFTDGWRSWALTPGGLVAWEGGGPPPEGLVAQGGGPATSGTAARR